MPSTPRSVRVNSGNDDYYLTAEALTTKSLLGVDRRQTMVDTIFVSGTGTVLSSITPPTDAVIAITGLSASHSNMTAVGTLFLEATTRGNEVMGTSSLGYGSFAAVSPILNLNMGAPSGTIPNLLPADTNILLVNGNAINPLWRIQVTALTAPDVVGLYIYYIAMYGEQLSCG